MSVEIPAISQEGEASASPTPGRRSAGQIVVWAIWAIMTGAALLYVARYGSNVPSWDEWDMVPALTGHQPVTWQWLWSQHNEHRVPVPRLALLAIGWAIGIDFRGAMYANVLLASALAAASLAAVHRVRGRASLADALIPLLLLNLAQGVNFIWGWQIEFFISTALAGTALLLIFLLGGRPGAGFALVMGLVLALLVGTGAHGVALVPALSAWLLVAAVLRWRETPPDDARARRESQRAASALFVAGLVGLALAALYFVGFEKVPYHPSSPGARASARTSVQFVTMALGPAVKDLWSASGRLVVLFLAGVGVIGLAALRHAAERTRALGLLAFLGAMGCLALGLGLGRDGFEPRYITLSVPALLAAYFILVAYARSRFGIAGQWCLLVAALLALWTNTRFGIDYGREVRANLAAFERDVAAGVPPYRLIHDYGAWLHPHADIVGDYLPMLRQAGVEPYARLRDNPPFTQVRVLLEPVEVHELTWDARSATASVSGHLPHLVFNLGKPMRVAGIRLRYSHSKPSGRIPYVAIQWKNGETATFDPSRSSKYSATGDHANWRRGSFVRLNDSESQMTVWVLDTIDSVRIGPDFEPCRFTIHALTLLRDDRPEAATSRVVRPPLGVIMVRTDSSQAP